MRIYASLALAACAALTVAGAASAAGKGDMTDTTYIAVAHCAGLAEGTGGDAAPFESVLNAQAGARSPDIIDEADQARHEAKKVSSTAGPDGKAGAVRERDGTCRSYLQQS